MNCLNPVPQAQPAGPPASPQAELHMRSLDLPGSRSGVLLFHSLSSGPRELQYLAHGLHRAGHTVQVPLLPGYSLGQPGQRLAGHVDWTAAALAAFDALQARCDTVAVGGLSVGAVLALQVAAQRASRVNALLALSTALQFDGWATPWTRRLLPLAAWLPGAGEIGLRMTAPFGVKDTALRDWIGTQVREAAGTAGVGAVLHVRDLLQVRRLVQDTRRRLPDITAPTLLLHAQHDDVASARSAHEVGQHIRSRQVTWQLFADSYHQLGIDSEKQQVLLAMRDFLQQLVDGKAGPSALLAQLDDAAGAPMSLDKPDKPDAPV